MKNYMKKIISAVFGFAIMFAGQSVFAASPLWNSASNDCPTVNIANYSTQVGYGNPCWNSTSVSASAGDSINVRVYYHNASDLLGYPINATNVRVVLNASSGSSTNHSISGQIVSDQGSIPFGPVNVTLSSAQTLSFGGTRWYPNQGSQASLPFGQSGSEIINGNGLRLGTVAPGWSTQGSVVVAFAVGNTQTASCSVSINANQTSVTSGNPATLSWTSNNCTSATISGPTGTISNSLNGSQVVYPTSTSTYTITGNNSNGVSQTQSVTVNVNQQVSNCTISNFNASSTSVTSGQGATLSWGTNNCTSATISGPTGTISNSLSGSQTVYPGNGSNTYRINAYGSNGGNVSQEITIYTNQVVNNVCAVTTVATNISRTGATLNGLVTNGSGSSNTYFEYGPTVSVEYRTAGRFVSGNMNFSETLTGLPSNATYYYRLVSECNGNISRGALDFFRTSGATQQVIVQGTTVVGTASPIMLKIENRYQYIGVGDTIEYAVTFKNIGKSTLTNPVLQIMVPKGITLTNATRGTYSSDTNTLTVPLPNLLPGAGDVLFAQGHVDSIPDNTAQIVTTAVLVYTAPNTAQENAIAYVLNGPKDGNNLLGAAALFGGLGSLSLVGWLLLAIIILALVLLARKMFEKNSQPTTSSHAVPTPTHTNHF